MWWASFGTKEKEKQERERKRQVGRQTDTDKRNKLWGPHWNEKCFLCHPQHTVFHFLLNFICKLCSARVYTALGTGFYASNILCLKRCSSIKFLPQTSFLPLFSLINTFLRWIIFIINYLGGDPLGQFAVENIENEWKVYVRKPLDREVKDNYLLNITATDGMFATKAMVEVKVLDANDNDPVCEKVLMCI